MSPQDWTISSSNVLTTNVWQQVTVTYDGQWVKLYHNGTNVGQTEAVQTTSFSTTHIGSY